MGREILKTMRQELQAAIITTPLIVSPKITVSEAIAQMADVGAVCAPAQGFDPKLPDLSLKVRSGCVLVVEENKLLGILTAMDVVRLIARQDLLENLTVADVMVCPVITLRESALTDALVAINLYQEHHIRHLPIVDESDRLIGLLSKEILYQVIHGELDYWTTILGQRDLLTRQAKALEAALRESEQRFSALFNSAFQFIGLLSPTGILLEVNNTALSVLGLSAESVVNQPFWETPWWQISSETQEQLRQAIMRAAQGEFVRYEVEVWGANQVVIPIDFSLRPIFDDTRQVIWLIPEGRNLTETKRLESERLKTTVALKESESKLQKLANVSPGIIYILVKKVNGTFAFEYISRAVEEIHEVKLEQVLADAQVILGQVHPDDLTDYQIAIRHSAETLEQFCHIFRVITPSGKLKWLKASACPEKKANGEIVWYGTATNITAQKQAEITLQKTNCELEIRVKQRTKELSAFKLALDESAIVVITDAQGVIYYVNERFCAISGYSREELIGQTHLMLKSDYYPPNFFEELWHTIAAGRIWRGEFCNRNKSGNDYWLDSTIVPFIDEQGNPFQYLAVCFDITKLRLAEMALRQENTFRQMILQNMAEGLCVCNQITEFPFMRFTVWNQRMEELTGYTLEAINNLGWYQSLYPDAELQNRAIARMARMRQGDNLVAEEWQIRRRDGQERTIAISTSILTPADGETYVLAIIQDITERHQSQEALKLSEERLRRYFDQSLIGMAITSPDKGWQDVNDCLCKILGYSYTEITQKTWAEMTHPDDLAADLAYFNRVLAGEIDGYSIDKRFIRKDGKTVHGMIAVQCLRNPDSTVNSFVAMVLDISDRKIAEEALLNYAREIEDIYNNAPCGYHSLDSEGRFLRINDRELEWLGYTRQEVIGRSFTDFLSKSSVETFYNNYPQFKQRGWVKDLEFELVTRDGTIFPVLVNATAVRDSQGNYLCSRSTMFDLRARKQYEAQLQQTNAELSRATRLKDEFLANMSHELRTPLNAILGMTEGLQDEVFGLLNPEQKKALQTVERAGNHLLEF